MVGLLLDLSCDCSGERIENRADCSAERIGPVIHVVENKRQKKKFKIQFHLPPVNWLAKNYCFSVLE